MEVTAKQRGWYRGQRVWPGDRVTLQDGDPIPSWAREVELKKPTAPPVKRRRRRTPAPKKAEQDTEQN